jgi:hypothetical protein
MSDLEKSAHYHSSIVRIGSGARCDLGDLNLKKSKVKKTKDTDKAYI